MDHETFVNIIFTTELLSLDDKDYFSKRSPLYPLHVRQKMSDVIEKEEEYLLGIVDKRRDEALKFRQKYLEKRLRGFESIHANEIKNAESQLESELATI